MFLSRSFLISLSSFPFRFCSWRLRFLSPSSSELFPVSSLLTPYFRCLYRYKVTLSNQSINTVNNVCSSSALPVSGRFGKQMSGKLHQVSLVNLILHLQICPLKTYSPGKKINFILLLNHFALCESAQRIFSYIQLGDCEQSICAAPSSDVVCYICGVRMRDIVSKGDILFKYSA